MASYKYRDPVSIRDGQRLIGGWLVGAFVPVVGPNAGQKILVVQSEGGVIFHIDEAIFLREQGKVMPPLSKDGPG